MATITGAFSNGSKNVIPWIEYTYTQSQTNLTTTITAKLYVKRATSYGQSYSSNCYVKLTIGGTNVVNKGPMKIDVRTLSVGSSMLVAEGSRTISHNSSTGALSASIGGYVDMSQTSLGTANFSQTINFPTLSVNSAPYFDSGAYVTIRENNSSGRVISASASGTENANKYPESVSNLYVSWPAAKDKEATSGMTYVLMCQANESSWWEQWRGSATSYTHAIGAGNQNQSIDYYVYAIDNKGAKSGNIVSLQIQKNKFTAATLGVSGNIVHSTGNQTITLSRTGAGNTYTTGAVVNYTLSAKIGSTSITVYNATAGGNLTIVPGTGTVTNPHIRLGDIRNAVKNSSFNGTLTLTLKSANSWGSSGTSSKDISVDLRTNPVAGSSGLSIDGSSYYAVPNGTATVNCIVPARKKIKLVWGAATDPNGTPITYRVEQQIGTGAWTTLTSSTSNTYYEFNANVSGKPTYKWRVYAKNSYGRELLLSGTPSAVLHNYSPPTISIRSTVRTAKDFTINFATSYSTEMSGNGIQSITLNYGGKDSPIPTNTTTAKLTGLGESSTGAFRLTIVDIHGNTFGVSGGYAEGSVPQFYPVLAIRKNGIGVKMIPDGTADFMIGGKAKITGGFVVHSAWAGSGTAGYLHIASIAISSSYQNAPIEFKIAQRGRKVMPTLSLSLYNANNNTPGINAFVKDSSDIDAYVKDTGAGVYDIYVKKTESYDRVDVVDFKKGDYLAGTTVTWKDSLVATLPSGAVTASLGGGVSFDKIYPVGSIYLSVNSTNPSSYFGGTWVAWGSGRVPVGVNTGDGDFNTVEKQGGAKTVTLTTAQMPSHTHTQNSHNHSQNAHTHTQNSHNHSQNAHSHGTRYKGFSGVSSSSSGFIMLRRNDSADSYDGTDSDGAISTTASNQATTATNQNTTATNNATTATNQNTGGGGSHPNLQPYITCYMWKRTA